MSKRWKLGRRHPSQELRSASSPLGTNRTPSTIWVRATSWRCSFASWAQVGPSWTTSRSKREESKLEFSRAHFWLKGKSRPKSGWEGIELPRGILPTRATWKRKSELPNITELKETKSTHKKQHSCKNLRFISDRLMSKQEKRRDMTMLLKILESSFVKKNATI